MLDILAHRNYRHLFGAQVFSLVGTGLSTVALGLLAYELAPERASEVLGIAFAIKMVAYVGLSPIAGAISPRLPRRALLVVLDILRAGFVFLMPFVSEVWQIYVLIFLLQACSAAFTPAFQATIPALLPDEKDYTKALSLSRLAYDLESLLSPMLAAVLLTVVQFEWLFGGTVVGFLLSAGLVVSARLPVRKPPERKTGFFEATTIGIKIYLKTPRLRGLLALNLAAASAGAMVIVNTVVYVRDLLGKTNDDVAFAMAAFGGGSMAAALILPKVLDLVRERLLMPPAAFAQAIFLGLLALVAPMLDETAGWYALLATWLLLGVGYSMIVTPAGRLLRRSAREEDLPQIFAAQFALSHVCWLITYPLSGWLSTNFGMPTAMGVLSLLCLVGGVIAMFCWPKRDPEIVEHVHNDLPPDHPHLKNAVKTKQGYRHAHVYVIDEIHPKWP